MAEVRTQEGKRYLFVAIDRTSKFAYAELHDKSARKISTVFLDHLVEAVPYKIHTVLTDNRIPFCHPPRYRNGPTAHPIRHRFGMCCDGHGIEHRMTKPKHPWTNGQVERMNRPIKAATVKRYYYNSHDPLKAHLHSFLMAYNFARRLKTLRTSHPMNTSAKDGQKNRNDLTSIHPSTLWD